MCSRGCSKVLLFIFNILFFFCGVLLLSFGIAGVANPIQLTGFLARVPGVTSMAIVINIPQIIVSCAIFMIVLGSIMVVFGFLGCAGAACSSKPLLFFYWLLLVLVILAELALIIYAAVSPATAQENIKAVMYKSLRDNFGTVSLGWGNNTVTLPANIISLSWVSMQFEVECCGVNNYTDYETFKWNNTFKMENGQSLEAKVPPSCCTLKQKSVVPRSTDDFVNLPSCLDTINSFSAVGCYAAVRKLAMTYFYIPIGICCAVIVVEIICMAAAIHLWRTNDEKKQIA
jgi:hypothetical protein